MGKTIAEKIFEAHLVDQPFGDVNVLRLDRVFCHEITTPTAIQDLVARGKDRVFDPDKIKAVIDHVTPAKDSKTAMQGKILREWARRHKIKDFFDIGNNGVCHAIFPEKGFVRPGFTIIMGDSHTCTHGAFGAFAAGVGTTDLEVGILKGVCTFKTPETFKIEVTGQLRPGVYAKDIILEVIRRITVNGATNMVIEFSGPVVDAMNMDQRMTLSNMAVEAGATSGICLPDMTTVEYLWPFIKDEFDTKADALAEYSKFCSDGDAEYARTEVVDVSHLAPQVTFGYKPDNVRPVSEMAGTRVDQVYIGSCTNGRLEDLRVAASVLEGKKISDRVRGIVSPATPDIFSAALAEGIIKTFMDAGFCVTNPTCGACLGMSNGVLADGEVAAATTNRNFNGRMGRGGMVHLMSPATAAATALAGEIANSDLFTEEGKMKTFEGKILCLDRADINTDEIIPAKYLTEIEKIAMKPHLLEDLKMEGFDPGDLEGVAVIVARENFGCGSSREHAPWALEVNGINVVIAPSFARIFRQNMFNCGMMAIELPEKDVDALFDLCKGGEGHLAVDVETRKISAASGSNRLELGFEISEFDKTLVQTGGWVEYADKNY